MVTRKNRRLVESLASRDDVKVLVILLPVLESTSSPSDMASGLTNGDAFVIQCNNRLTFP
jgi:hypothetical protein